MGAEWNIIQLVKLSLVFSWKICRITIYLMFYSIKICRSGFFDKLAISGFKNANFLGKAGQISYNFAVRKKKISEILKVHSKHQHILWVFLLYSLFLFSCYACRDHQEETEKMDYQDQQDDQDNQDPQERWALFIMLNVAQITFWQHWVVGSFLSWLTAHDLINRWWSSARV